MSREKYLFPSTHSTDLNKTIVYHPGWTVQTFALLSTAQVIQGKLIFFKQAFFGNSWPITLCQWEQILSNTYKCPFLLQSLKSDYSSVHNEVQLYLTRYIKFTLKFARKMLKLELLVLLWHTQRKATNSFHTIAYHWYYQPLQSLHMWRIHLKSPRMHMFLLKLWTKRVL